MSELSSDRGFTLIEVLMSMTLFIIVLAGALLSFNAFQNSEARSQDLTDSQVQVRVTLDLLAKQLRNLASPDDLHPDSIEWAQPFDLVFRTVNPVGTANSANVTNLERVRYCLDTVTNAADATLYRQVEIPKEGQGLRSFDTSVDSSGVSYDPLVHPGCPVTSLSGVPTAPLSTTRVIGQHVTNARPSSVRPLFTYRPAASPTSDISVIAASIFVDVNALAKTPAETNLTTSAFLRNQNRRPVAEIETPTVTTNNHILLNGSGSFDPEGTSLTYSWVVKVGGATATGGTSNRVIFDFAGVANTKYSVSLVVQDSGRLSSDAATVCAQTGTATCP